MVIDGKPVWVFSPNWANGILERLEWKTDVLTSATGAEQRRCMRLSPRRTFEATFYMHKRARQDFDIAMVMAGGVNWYIPLWHEVFFLPGALASGAGVLPIPSTNREFRDGDYVLILGHGITNPLDAEIVQCSTINETELQLIANTTKSWLPGSRVYPLRLARLVEQPALTKRTDNFWEAQCSFRLMEANDYPDTPTMPTYEGFPVFTVRPDESEDITATYVRMMLELDNQSGIPQYYDTAGQGFTQQQYRWGVYGRANNAELRRVFYKLRGRWKSFWMPTYMMDLTLTRTLALGATEMYVENVERSSYVTGVVEPAARTHIRVELMDGTYHYAKIASGEALTVDEEIINLETGFDVEITATNVRTISYMALSRFDADSVEINHETDSAGLTRSVMSIRSAPSLRDASEWDPPAILGFSGTVNCLDQCEAPIAVLADRARTPGIFLPVTNEVWFQSYPYEPNVLDLGYRYDADTLELKGTLTNDSPTGPFVNTFEMRYMTYDSLRQVVWAIALRGGDNDGYVMKFDAMTGECLAAVHPTTATNLDRRGQQWQFFLNPVTFDPWIITAQTSPVSKWAHRLNETTLQPSLSYELDAGFTNGWADWTGDFFFVKSSTAAPFPDQIWKVNTVTGAVTLSYTHTQVFVDVIRDTRRNSIYLDCPTIGSPAADFTLVDFDTFNEVLTGREIVVPAHGNFYNLYGYYDPVNDAVWIQPLDPTFLTAGQVLQAYRMSDGMFVGSIAVGSSSLYPYYYDDTFGPMTFPTITTYPNAVYLIGEQEEWYDADFNAVGPHYYLTKVPICNRLLEGEYLPSRDYGLVFPERGGIPNYNSYRLPVVDFSFMLFGRDIRTADMFMSGDESTLTFVHEFAGTITGTLGSWIGFAMGAGDRTNIRMYAGKIDAFTYKIRWEGFYDYYLDPLDAVVQIWWELVLKADHTMELTSHAVDGAAEDAFYDVGFDGGETYWMLSNGLGTGTAPDYTVGPDVNFRWYPGSDANDKTFIFTPFDVGGNIWSVSEAS